MPSKKDATPEPFSKAWLVVVPILMIALWIGTPFALYWWFPCDMSARGQFGDMFGMVNSLFAGFALIGVVATIWIQMRDLRIQSKALQDQDERLKESNLLLTFQSMFQAYRSAEMLLAVKALWDLRRRHEKDDTMVSEYLETMKREFERIAGLDPLQQVQAVQGTLHHRRRIVENFYYLIAGIRESNVIDDAMFYKFWNRLDLEIIPKVLIPIADGLERELNQTRSNTARSRLLGLYERAPAQASPSPTN